MRLQQNKERSLPLLKNRFEDWDPEERELGEETQDTFNTVLASHCRNGALLGFFGGYVGINAFELGVGEEYVGELYEFIISIGFLLPLGAFLGFALGIAPAWRASCNKYAFLHDAYTAH